VFTSYFSLEAPLSPTKRAGRSRLLRTSWAGKLSEWAAVLAAPLDPELAGSQAVSAELLR
jgi:hypothetical protein